MSESQTTKWTVTMVFSPFDPDHYQNRIVSQVFESQPDDDQIKKRFGVLRFTKPWETECEPGLPLHPYLNQMMPVALGNLRRQGATDEIARITREIAQGSLS